MNLSEGYTVWDVVNHLETREDIILYLEAASEEDAGDGSIIRMAIKDVARAQNMSALAQHLGMSRAGLYKALSPSGNPSFATIMRLTRALGIQVILRPMPSDQPHPEETPEPAETRSPTTSVG